MPPEFKDYYKVLGLDSSAGQDEIKRAFRKLARAHHPDVNKGPDSEARFKEISAAYEILGDTKKRAEYDQLYTYWKQGGRFSGRQGRGGGSGFGPGGASIDLEELFNSLFGDRQDSGAGQSAWFGGFSGAGGFPGAGFPGGGPSGFGQPCSRPAPTPRDVELSLEEAFSGCKRLFDVQSADGGNKRIQVTIPAGVTEGQTIQLGAKPGNGSAMGALQLKVRLLPHRHFRVEGRDIHLDLPIAPWEAALGATVEAPTLGGTVRLKVPPGSQSGGKLALKGRGLPGNPPGNQYVTLHIVLPTPATESHRTFYEKMQREMPFDPRAGMLS